MKDKHLPINWITIKLENIAQIQSGGTPSRSVSSYWGGNVPWIKISDIKDRYIKEAEEYITEEGVNNSSAKVFKKGTVLFSIFATIGKVGILDIDAATNQAIVGIVPDKDLDKVYLMYVLKNLSHQIAEQGKGIAQKNINISILKKTLIPLPPLAEQKRIADKLDVLFGQLNIVQKAIERIPELIKNFRQQILSSAVTGKLTEEWRDRENILNEYREFKCSEYREYNFEIPDQWILLSFADVVRIESNLVNPIDYPELPLIAPDNIESMTGRIISKPTVAEINPISPKYLFSGNSLIYSKIRPYLSKIAFVDFKGLCSADMYPLKTSLDIHYLYYYMLSPEFLYYATTAGERIVLPKINRKGLNIIPIPVPSIEEQKEIVRRIDSFFKKLETIEQQYNALKSKIEKLPQALLNKAFSGELVEHLPSDGDAETLLKEIEQLKRTISKK